MSYSKCLKLALSNRLAILSQRFEILFTRKLHALRHGSCNSSRFSRKSCQHLILIMTLTPPSTSQGDWAQQEIHPDKCEPLLWSSRGLLCSHTSFSDTDRPILDASLTHAVFPCYVWSLLLSVISKRYNFSWFFLKGIMSCISVLYCMYAVAVLFWDYYTDASACFQTQLPSLSFSTSGNLRSSPCNFMFSWCGSKSYVRVQNRCSGGHVAFLSPLTGGALWFLCNQSQAVGAAKAEICLSLYVPPQPVIKRLLYLIK